MKRFRFPLQVLRTIREQKEQTAQKRYADALRVSKEAERDLEAVQVELVTNWSLLQELLAASAPASDLNRIRAYDGVLLERSARLERAKREADEHVGRTWKDMCLATRDREAIDHYHDKHRRAYDRDVLRDEQKHLDELGTRLPGHAFAWRRAEELEVA
ncbi:MAG: hypothetical protein HZA90_17075 [Verrucomicrobia bacterium]|nr:hypothetical protein [Verrucomicrobiota bacterium]